MPDISYDIIAFDEDIAQIVIQFEGFAPHAVDLPIDDAGNVPEGADLDAYIRGFLPVWEMERRERARSGIANAAAIRALVRERPPAEPEPVITPAPADLRAFAYRQEADPIFFKAQRGEATMEDWQAKIAEIRDRYPYPDE